MDLRGFGGSSGCLDTLGKGEQADGRCYRPPHTYNEDVRSGVYTAFDGASELLGTLPASSWALVTSNYGHRVRGRFARTGLPLPRVIVDAAAVEEGKPSPVPYLLAANSVPGPRTAWSLRTPPPESRRGCGPA